MKANSAISARYKTNIVDCLVDRARKINLSQQSFSEELQKIRTFFCQNGFNLNFVNKRISIKIHQPISDQTVATVKRKDIYCKIPFISAIHNKDFEVGMKSLVSKFYPQVNLRLIFCNNNTIANMFPYKDLIPQDVKSNIVYKYSCGMCDSTYIGETTRHYKTRIAEHMGVSARTGRPIITRSNIFDHKVGTGHPISEDNFSIINCSNSWDVKLSESIAIHIGRPVLNAMLSSMPLNILV